jgi:hypothetical protein
MNVEAFKTAVTHHAKYSSGNLHLHPKDFYPIAQALQARLDVRPRSDGQNEEYMTVHTTWRAVIVVSSPEAPPGKATSGRRIEP